MSHHYLEGTEEKLYKVCPKCKANMVLNICDNKLCYNNHFGKCYKHPKYTGRRRKPTSKCKVCWAIWNGEKL